MIALVRSLSDACSVAQLKSDCSKLLSTKSSNDSRSFNNYKPVNDSLLLLGRFCWLLKINGNPIINALSTKPVSNKYHVDQHDDYSNHNSASYDNNNLYYTSYEQLQSAFDIADSDGDGKITYWEATEVIQLFLRFCFIIMY